jgi:hypothetical protein
LIIKKEGKNERELYVSIRYGEKEKESSNIDHSPLVNN